MNQTEHYDKALLNISPKEWPVFLKENAHLSDGSINIQLARAFAEIATLMDFKRYIRMDYLEAPEGSPEEFLTYCGVLGYGVYLAQYFDGSLLAELRERANDSRENIREAVVLTLKYIGRKNIFRLLDYLDNWIDGTPLEQQAAIASLCEPEFLKKSEAVQTLLDILDWATASIHGETSLNCEYEVLQTELEQAWSIGVIAGPARAKSLIERWLKENDPLINLIMKKNLKEQQLQEAEPKWTQQMLDLIKKSS